ncbi:hypothetical protein [uncultured Paraglaciecola sp.]|uniref:hypothetical protein n=1 Tax=uncultured Paraglaciecola sp. TaxID=1765024 RepID=UPI00261533D0|nr:hypothetical protein [uncultured Paraglaciecola sp.]
MDLRSRAVGNHKHVFEYDGAFECVDCKSQWGAFPGKPTMPDKCLEINVSEEDKPFIKKAGKVTIDKHGITVEDFEVDYNNPVCDGCRSVAIAGAAWALRQLADALEKDTNGQQSGIGLG